MHPACLTPLSIASIKTAMRRNLRSLLGLLLGLALAGCSLLSRAIPGTPSATNTPGPAPTDTTVPGATPTNTPVPIVRVSSGDKSLFNGDIDSAMLQYRAASKETTDPDIRSAALWGLARAQYADSRCSDAIATLDGLVADYPTSPYAAPASFIKAQCLFDMQHYAEAAAAYQVYLSGRAGVLDSYVQQLRGDALTQAGSYSDALAAYTSAQSAPHLDDAQSLNIKIAQSHAGLGEYDTAISLYDTVATNTTNDYIRAQMDYLAAQAYLAQGNATQAYERLKHSIANYPRSNYSYLGLVQLLAANIAVDDFDRGLTDYFAGQYDVAVTALDRYIAANPVNDGTAHYYRAYALEELQQYQKSVDEFTSFIQNYPSNPHWVDGWEEKSNVQWYRLNQYPEAAQTLLDYVTAAPGSSQAPDELMRAARIYERDGRFDDAAHTWQRVADEYPGNSQAPTGVFYAGIMQYRQADYSSALPLFERSLVLSTQAEDQARAYLWIGKTQQKLGDNTTSQNSWQQGQLADPGGYYSQRATDLLMGSAPFAPPPTTKLDLDLVAERQSADAWMRLTFKLPDGTDFSGLGALASDPRVIRGRELWNLGLFDDARLEFEDLRCDLATQAGFDCQSLARLSSAAVVTPEDTARLAVLTYQLANYLLDLGPLPFRHLRRAPGSQPRRPRLANPEHARPALFHSRALWAVLQGSDRSGRPAERLRSAAAIQRRPPGKPLRGLRQLHRRRARPHADRPRHRGRHCRCPRLAHGLQPRQALSSQCEHRLRSLLPRLRSQVRRWRPVRRPRRLQRWPRQCSGLEAALPG